MTRPEGPAGQASSSVFLTARGQRTARPEGWGQACTHFKTHRLDPREPTLSPLEEQEGPQEHGGSSRGRGSNTRPCGGGGEMGGVPDSGPATCSYKQINQVAPDSGWDTGHGQSSPPPTAVVFSEGSHYVNVYLGGGVFGNELPRFETARNFILKSGFGASAGNSEHLDSPRCNPPG